MKKLQNILISKIKPPANAARSLLDPDSITELADSIKKLGLLQPILIRKVGKQYEIEAGHRRYLAVKQLGWESIDCIALDTTDEDELHLERAHENLIREDLNPLDEAALIYKLVYEDGRGVDDTAKLLCKKPSWIIRRMDILQWPEDIKTALKLGHITIAVGNELSRLKDDETRSRLLDATIQYGATSKVVKQWIDDMSVDRYFDSQAADKEMGENISVGMSGTQMECRICGIYHDLGVLRHVWLCPDCLMGIRELARETRLEIAKKQKQEK